MTQIINDSMLSSPKCEEKILFPAPKTGTHKTKDSNAREFKFDQEILNQ